MKYLITIFFSLNIGIFAQGRLPSDKNKTVSSDVKMIPQKLKQKTSAFFEFLLDSNVSAGYNELFKDSFIKDQTGKIQALINQTHRAFQIYGRLKGYEPVNAEQISKSFIRVRFIGLHSRFPMRWIFTFYNAPENGWILTNVTFDDLTEFYFSDE